MKLSTVLFLLGMMSAQAEGLAQEVTIVRSKLSLKDVFREIKKQTGYNFLWGAKSVNSSIQVDIDLKERKLEDAIGNILSGMPLQFEIVDKTILIKEKYDRKKKDIKPRVHSIINSSLNPNILEHDHQNQRLREVRGVIVDSLQRPIAGVSIQVFVGSQKSPLRSQSTASGTFLLKDVPDDATLWITFLGYEPIRIKAVANLGTLTLREIPKKIEEVVVTGIFERSASTYTGAAHTLKKEDIRRVGNQNILDVLSVLDPSIQSLQDLANGSDPNKIANLQLRGASSLPTTGNVSALASSNIRSDQDLYSAYDKKVDNIKDIYKVNPNLPLFILDGFEVSIQRISDLDLNEVERVTILKDASATAIYGSRGANGVIVFERVRPQPGTMLFNYKADLTFEFPDLRDYRLLNSAQKLEVEQLAGVYSNSYTNIDVPLKQIYNERLKEVLRGQDTYWPSVPLRNAVSQKHRINMEGGDRKVNYGVDFTYNRINGVMKGSSRTNYNGGFTLRYRSERFQVQNQLNLQFTDAVNSPWGTFSQYVRMNPYFTPYDENRNIKQVLQEPLNNLQYPSYGYIYNPVYNSTLNGKDFTKTRNLINNTALIYKFTKDFNVRGRLSITNQTDNSELFLPADHTVFKQKNTDIFKRGAYTAGFGKLFNYDGNIDLNYTLSRNKHQLFTTLSGRLNQNTSENVVVQVEGLPSAQTDQIFYGRNYLNDRPGGAESTIRTVGFLGNTNYAYDNRYLLDFSYRLDGSSSVGADRLFAPFWSIGAGWNLHSEKMLRRLVEVAVLDQLRIRSSIGVTGAQQFDPYMAYRTYNYALNEAYLNGVGATLLNVGNENLTWQATRKFNLGLDLTAWKNRLNFTADYYSDFTDKFIADFSLPLSTGFETYKGNLGAIKSRGYEARISYQVVKATDMKDFGLTLGANIGSNKSTIDKISDELKAQNNKLQTISNTTKPFTRYEEGAAVDAIWVVPSLGIDPATGEELFLKKDGSVTFKWDANDMIAAGVSNPKYHGTFNINASFQNVQLNAYFTYRGGGQLYNSTLLEKIENVNLVDNADVRVLTERWRNPGDQTFFKSIMIGGAKTNASSRFVQNDNLLDMSSASILYRFDPRIIKRYKLRTLNVGIYTQNVFRLSSIKAERGFDYPFARNFSLSLQASF